MDKLLIYDAYGVQAFGNLVAFDAGVILCLGVGMTGQLLARFHF